MTELSDVLTETIELPVADGTTMGGYLARPARSRPAGAVIVGFELFGISAHVRDVCERLATLGYLALAPDLYHRSGPRIELAHDEDGVARGLELLHEVTREAALADVRAARDELIRRGAEQTGMVGLSVGGHVAYLAATQLHLAAVAIVYGGWIPTTEIPLSRPEPTLALTPGITGRVLFLVGETDALVVVEHRRAIVAALAQAGVRHEIVEYPGVGHGFFCARRAEFDAAAAEDAWRRIAALLASELQPLGGAAGADALSAP